MLVHVIVLLYLSLQILGAPTNLLETGNFEGLTTAGSSPEPVDIYAYEFENSPQELEPAQISKLQTVPNVEYRGENELFNENDDTFACHQDWSSLRNTLEIGDSHEMFQITAETTITKPYRVWMQIRFDQPSINLRYGPNLYQKDLIRLESDEDKEVQILDLKLLQEWKFNSAYFNGNSVRVQLLTHPCNPNATNAPHIQIEGTKMSPVIDFEEEKFSITLKKVSNALPEGPKQSLCGDTDTRGPSADMRVGRMFPTQCTAFLGTYGNQTAYFTAGHCAFVADDIVVQHNVPRSYISGQLRHPSPKYQVPIARIIAPGREQIDEGFDFALLKLTPSYLDMPDDMLPTNLKPFKLAPKDFNFKATIELAVTGYGIAVGSMNQIQQTAIGPFYDNYFNETDNLYAVMYRVDAFKGNSGSPVVYKSLVDEQEDVVVAIHTNAGCNASSAYSSNLGTWMHHPSLLSLFNSSDFYS